MNNCLPLITAEQHGSLQKCLYCLECVCTSKTSKYRFLWFVYLTSSLFIPMATSTYPVICMGEWQTSWTWKLFGVLFSTGNKTGPCTLQESKCGLGLSHSLVSLQIDISLVFFFSFVHFGRFFKRKLSKSPFHIHFDDIRLIFIPL